ncbi:MAG: ATP-dependent Clp protease proteolytic subunit [Candidatus Yanofskybacteria bacterium GW2011_GWA1_39_13]|uniref:ATP-dependent Clp protease proteolytic subunit n=1 Tax=Yanofskybacteria sp. (strain GW2011_GWA1_39_13) TaxID=1619019 RepID=A0A0G0MQ18_YANXG|nr:MAG: ATP-dependent Clp protease proteolytic subunit [Candidatus Yanofskybacteria bacterium GW2011_GWA1_39_13]
MERLGVVDLRHYNDILLLRRSFIRKKMKQPLVRRHVDLDIVDEKMEFLADKGIFILGGDVCMESFYALLVGILPKLYTQRDRRVWVILNSPGGDIFQGFAMYDFLKAIANQGVEVNVVGMGMVASMAVCIMQAGTKRYAFPNTQFTVHQASLSGGDQSQEVNEMIETAREVERINKIVLGIISERSGMDMEELLKISKKTDYSVDARNAIAGKFGPQGLIDEVITMFPFQING